MLRAYTLLAFEIKLNRFLVLNTSDAACVSYCRVCASVREDNPRAFAIGLSPVQTHEPYINLFIAPAFICTLCFARYLTLNIGISMNIKKTSDAR